MIDNQKKICKYFELDFILHLFYFNLKVLVIY